MKNILIIIFMLFPAGASIAQSGQNAPQGQQPPVQAVQPKQDTQKPAAQAQHDQQKKPAADVSDTFKPSEEIDEDLAVSLPVDI